MSAASSSPQLATTRGQEAHRLFLVVVDDSDELPAAIYYACVRARQTGGRVALLYVYQIDIDFHHWKFVSALVEQEAQQEAENVLKLHAVRVVQETGRRPEMYVRKGNRREELFKLVKEHPEISILVLSAAVGKKPGPLVEAVTGKYAGKIGIPVTVVPGKSPRQPEREAS
ncbi:MAG: universal stress protein [Rhodospirillaceae bacterium]|nr:universal stress protein [Rhodospirillaceae bacterium]